MAELRKRGLSTAVICSTPFEKLGRAQARVFGVPDLPLVMIRHPLGGLELDDVRARAQEAVPAVVDLLRGRME
ncbi:MAG TPA: hypothetical protein VGQ54_15180 [Burkholderiales bacterium]|jgi:hypothetical protein|nr:hypothetical protein [Burkholderiales bacterium]